MAEVNVPNKPTATVTVTPKHASSISSSGSITVVDGDTIKDVSLFSICDKYSDDPLYIKAPKGVLRETDEVVFARRASGKTRPVKYVGKGLGIDGGFFNTDSQKQRKRYKGWIRPRIGTSVSSGRAYFPSDGIRMNLRYTSDGYDYFELNITNSNSKLSYEILRETDLQYKNRPNLAGKHLGVCVKRNGKMIVDYLSFTIWYDEERDYAYIGHV